jgi:uncharacterized protein
VKPLPKITVDTRPFWDGCLQDELRYQRCDACGEAQFPPGTVCTHCHAGNPDWHVSQGLGTVYSFSVVKRAPTAEFKTDAPYVLALVDLAEGFRMMVNVRNVPPETVTIGMPVRIIFEATERDDVKLPQAEPA